MLHRFPFHSHPYNGYYSIIKYLLKKKITRPFMKNSSYLTPET